MATNKTSFLNLNDWAGSDQFRREEINANFRALDAKAKEHDDSIGNLSKAASEYEWTSTAGQLTYVMPSGQTYDPTTKWFEVTVGGAPVPLSQIQMDSASQFTLLVDASAIPAGVKVVARWVEPFVPATAGHHTKHELGGADEIDITKLKNFTEQVATPLAEISTNVKAFGAKGDGVADDTTAIQNALNSGAGIVFLPKGTYKITASLTIPSLTKMIGTGRKKTVIVQFTNNIPIIDIGEGQYKTIEAMSLKYSVWQGYSNTNAKGIGKLTNNPLGQSIFRELEIEGAYDGFYSANQFYSNTIKDLWIYSYSRSAMYLEGTGGTGCVLSNIYTTNWNNYALATKLQADYAFFFQGFSESSATQLNIEHSKLVYGIYLNSVDNFKLTSIHIEGYEHRGDDFGGVIGVQSSQVDFDSVTMGFSWKADGISLTNFNFFALKGNATVSAKNIVTRDNSVVWGVQKDTSGIITNLVYSSDTTSYIVLDNTVSKDGYFQIVPVSVTGLPFKTFKPTTSSGVRNNSIFIDSADGKLKFKGSTGIINLLY